jgi:hypothetical protein
VNGDNGRKNGREGRGIEIRSPSNEDFGRGGVTFNESGVEAFDESFLRRQNEGRRAIAFVGGGIRPLVKSCSLSFPFPAPSEPKCTGPRERPLLRLCSTTSDMSSC